VAIATDIIQDSIKETKGIFFPIKKEFWLKIGFVSILHNKKSFNLNYTSPNIRDFTRFINFIKTHIKLILPVSTGIFLIGILFSIISYTFNFIFLESLFSRKVLIKEYFKKFLRKGLSLFWLNFIIGSISLVLLVILALPLLIPLVKNWNNLSWAQFNIPYLIFFAVIFILDLILFGLIGFVINNFVVIDMYTRDTGSFDSFKKMLKLVKAEHFESFIYLLMRIVIAIATAIISIIVFIAMLIVFLLIAAIIAAVFYLLYLLFAPLKLFLIIFGVTIAIILFIALLYLSAVILSPIEGFYYLYAYKFFNELKKRNKNLFKHKIFQNG